MKTKRFIYGLGCLSSVPQVFSHYFSGYVPLIISDSNTWKACGETVHQEIEKSSIPCRKYVFEESPASDMKTVTQVQNLIREDTILISVGSGTINDLCKLASYNKGKQYISVCTAPSVDGYNSFGAAINVNGFKKTIPCNPPLAVIADTGVLSKAPYQMLSSGYGDLYAKIPAGADWIIADLLGIQKIMPEAWNCLHTELKNQLSDPEGFARRNPEAIGNVFKGLINSGFAIQILNESRPASGAEHLFSHMLEMEHWPASHGHKVALGSLISLSMYEYLLSLDSGFIKKKVASKIPQTWEERKRHIEEYFGNSPLLCDVLAASADKFCQGEKMRQRLDIIYNNIDEIKQRVSLQIVPYEKAISDFKTVKCPVKPADINMSVEHFKSTIIRAQMIRQRYTIFDFLYETGLFEDALDSIIHLYV